MKPSLRRYILRNEGYTILRSQAFHTKSGIAKGISWRIVKFNGNGWSPWELSDVYDSLDAAENAIDCYCEIDQSVINDSTITS
ncbi:MAG: hypothetical protein ACOYN5_10965 [Bacteroidales bacterium]